MDHAARFALLALLCLCATAAATRSPPAPAALPSPLTAGEDAPVSQAELLLRIRQAITEDLQRANLLRVRGRHLEREFEDATRSFDALDAALESGAASAPSDDQWRLARDLLDILLHRRQSQEQQLQVLEHKRETYEEAADFVATGEFDPGPDATPEQAGAAPAAQPSAAPGATQPASSTPPTPATPMQLATGTGTPATASPVAAPEPPVYDRRVAEAERELQRAETALRRAEFSVRIIEELVSLNQDERALVESGMLLARRHAELLHAAARAQPAASDAPGSGTAAAATDAAPTAATPDSVENARASGLEQRAARASEAVRRDQQRMGELERRLQALKELRDAAQELLLASGRDYEAQRRALAFLRSPLAPHRIWNWAVGALPRVLVLLAMLAVAWVLGRWVARRLVDAAVTRIRRSANEERVQRVQTLRRALRSVLTVLLSLAVALLVLPEFGIDATVLLGSAAVLSLALAFGAQSLIKDYFSGFMILSENQYRIGNVVRINDTAGVVEDISLRMTMLRDAEGVAHFVPHGEIRSVSNMSHGWSQALVDVRVGYGENVDQVMDVLRALAQEMRRDPEFGPLVLADPELWGVEELAETAVVVRLVMRTRPLRQWAVKRELLRRIKNRFDELGIERPASRLSVQQAPAPAPRGGHYRADAP